MRDFAPSLVNSSLWLMFLHCRAWEGTVLTPDDSGGPQLLNCTAGDCVVQDSAPNPLTHVASHGTTSGNIEPRMYERLARVYRCNREDPLVSTPIAKYDTYITTETECEKSESLFLCDPDNAENYDSKPTDYFSSSEEPSCEDVADNVGIVGLTVSNWTRIPEDHHFWKEYLAFYNPVAKGPGESTNWCVLKSQSCAEYSPLQKRLALLPMSFYPRLRLTQQLNLWQMRYCHNRS